MPEFRERTRDTGCKREVERKEKQRGTEASGEYIGGAGREMVWVQQLGKVTLKSHLSPPGLTDGPQSKWTRLG